MRKHIFILVLLPMVVIGQTQTENYIKTTTYKVAPISAFTVPTITQASQNITYFDGLGRPVQQIAHQQSGTGKDIVTPIEYDVLGRQAKEYLPYVPTTTASLDYKPTALTDVLNYSQYAGQNPFSEKKLESSPLNRVLKQAAPGTITDWALNSGHEIKLDYQTNTTADAVKLFSVTANWDVAKGLYDIPTSLTPTNYADFQLYKTITYDENTAAVPSEFNGATVEFKNKQGQVVLKRTYENTIAHNTYYVYDQYGNLTFVIPPLVDATTTITSAILGDLCYQYKYDSRNRLVEKKLPSKQWEFIVYDKLDRVVATGPAFSPFSDSAAGVVGWLITKYDIFNRPVYTGWEQSTTVTSAGRLTKQNTMNGLAIINESKQTSGTIDNIAVYYSNGVAPTNFKLLTVNYYDNYTFPNLATIPTSVETQPVLAVTKLQSLATGSWIRTLRTSTSIVGETSTSFFDEKARPIRNYNQNYLGGYTYIDSKLDKFSGQLQYTVTKHKRTSTDTELTIKEYFTYTPQDRILTHTHQVNSLPVQLLVSNTYDELGQLIGKNVGNTIAAPLQKINYAYNIRGWMTGINEITNLIQGSDPKDLFSFKINYNTVENCTGYTGTSLYNGNISETYWRTNSDNVLRKYGYKYDNLNRLKASIYQKPNTSSPVPGSYNENLYYDKNGNISYLERNGDIENALPANGIDYLSYTYAPNSNKLLGVIDYSNNTSGFKDSNQIGDDYTYDANGNLTTDKNKYITNITYNHLNLPTNITFATTGNITYIYNALGQKVQKIVNYINLTSNYNNTADYINGFVYTYLSDRSGIKPAKLNYFNTPEGYITVEMITDPNDVTCFCTMIENYKYIYNYKDHLGNVRLSYTKNTDGSLAIIEENNYYPFGLKHNGYNNTVASGGNDEARKYKYNGKELQDELGLNMYDYGARNYDPAIGRWMNMDNHAGSYTSYSPYNYGINNPTNVIDPDGNDIYILIWATDRENGKYGHAGIAVDNYKKQNKKDSQGNNVLDENGNAVTEMVKDGTYTYYDLWPGIDNDGDGTGDDFGSAGPNLRDSFVGMPAYYQNRKLNNLNGDPSAAEGYSPDGIIKLNAGYDETMETVEDLDSYMASNKNYKSALNNCSNFALEATLEALDKMGAFTSRGAMESYLEGYTNIVTPNQLYKYLQKIVSSNPTEGRVVKSPGKKVDEKFTSNKEIKGN